MKLTGPNSPTEKACDESPHQGDYPNPSRPPLQFGLRALFAATAATAMLFGTLRWLGAPPVASAVVLAVLVFGVVAAVALVVAIARSIDQQR